MTDADTSRIGNGHLHPHGICAMERTWTRKGNEKLVLDNASLLVGPRFFSAIWRFFCSRIFAFYRHLLFSLSTLGRPSIRSGRFGNRGRSALIGRPHTRAPKRTCRESSFSLLSRAVVFLRFLCPPHVGFLTPMRQLGRLFFFFIIFGRKYTPWRGIGEVVQLGGPEEKEDEGRKRSKGKRITRDGRLTELQDNGWSGQTAPGTNPTSTSNVRHDRARYDRGRLVRSLRGGLGLGLDRLPSQERTCNDPFVFRFRSPFLISFP